ncbi:alpha/beta hydrolase [Paenibacillus sp. 598K]|uniref:alpha/beta fold hydrolase n=1 Tax=Paenibacillus sp. 598K TaxID=1117987 RepID=UPI000FFA34FD|nr:alpha/beta hydrolase [Paenibacillus sp. 598K]GBF78295.1 alpha/beta hydrolase [Paenibacillus sp. 598K]
MITLADKKMHGEDGSVIAYYDNEHIGKTAGPTVILLHGYCGSSAYWERVLPTIKDAGRVIIPDLRGHGASSAPESDTYAMEDFADDVIRLMDHLYVHQAYLIGHSLGGYITLAAAERHAERLCGFGLVHSTAYADSEEAKAGRDRAAASIEEAGVDAFVEGLVPKLFAPEHLESMPEQVERVKAIGRGTSPRGAAASARGMKARPDRNAVLEGTQLPVLLLAGGRDGLIASERTFSVTRSNVKHALLEQSGHLGMIETPEEEAAELLAFVQR